MKKFIAAAFLMLSLSPIVSSATAKAVAQDHHDTKIVEVKIDYARALSADDSHGFSVQMAAIGGQVVFEGHAPVFVTIKAGGQIYTFPCDKLGNFSTFIYTNGYNRFTVEGWSPHEAAEQRVLPIVEGTIK
jgi:hypothetical protein